MTAPRRWREILTSLPPPAVEAELKEDLLRLFGQTPLVPPDPPNPPGG